MICLHQINLFSSSCIYLNFVVMLNRNSTNICNILVVFSSMHVNCDVIEKVYIFIYDPCLKFDKSEKKKTLDL